MGGPPEAIHAGQLTFDLKWKNQIEQKKWE